MKSYCVDPEGDVLAPLFVIQEYIKIVAETIYKDMTIYKLTHSLVLKAGQWIKLLCLL